MSFNGSGSFAINSTGQPVVSGTVISSSTFNALTADLATGLSTCITKDGQTTVTANIPMNSYKITGLAAGTAATDAARVGQLQAGGATLVTVAGTDTYTGTMSPSLGAYAAGNVFTFVVPNTNTTAATLNIDGLGAKALTRDGSTALVAGDLVANAEVAVVYDGTRFQVLNSNSKTNFNLSGTLTVAGNTTLSGGTANGVAYLNGSKVLTTGSALTFDGTNLSGTGSIGTTIASKTAQFNAAGGSIYASFADGTNTWRIGDGIISAGQFNLYDVTNSQTTLGFVAGAAGYSAFYQNNAEQMRLTSTGLGIGTSSPGAKLHVFSGAINEAIRLDASSTYNTGINWYNNGTIKWATQVLGDGTNAYRWYNFTAGSESMRLDSSGNLGLGVTPSAWGSNARVIQMAGTGAVFGQTNANIVSLTENMYWDNTNFKYIATDTAAKYTLYQGQHIWQNAVSGTAGTNITFKQAMTLDNAGTLTVGDGSIANQIQVNSSSWANHILKSPNTNGGSIYWNNGTTNKGEIFYYHVSDYMSFTTNSVERARIDSSGNLLVGTTNSSSSAGAGFKVTSPVAGHWDAGIVTTANSASYSCWDIYSTATSSYRFYVTTTGVINAVSNTITTISDQRLKENIRDLDDGLATVMALKPRKFDWKESKGAGTKNVRGFIAQEFEQVFPDLIDEWKDPAPEGEEPYKAIRADLIPTLVKAMQEQQALIESLTARLNALENK